MHLPVTAINPKAPMPSRPAANRSSAPASNKPACTGPRTAPTPSSHCVAPSAIGSTTSGARRILGKWPLTGGLVRGRPRPQSGCVQRSCGLGGPRTKRRSRLVCVTSVGHSPRICRAPDDFWHGVGPKPPPDQRICRAPIPPSLQVPSGTSPSAFWSAFRNDRGTSPFDSPCARGPTPTVALRRLEHGDGARQPTLVLPARDLLATADVREGRRDVEAETRRVPRPDLTHLGDDGVSFFDASSRALRGNGRDQQSHTQRIECRRHVVDTAGTARMQHAKNHPLIHTESPCKLRLGHAVAR